MQVKIRVHITLDPAEYFPVGEAHDLQHTRIQAQRMDASAESKWVYCLGPKLLRSGKPSGARNGCVMLELSGLPAEVQGLIRTALVPYQAEPAGAEAARQAALG
jgi:hypothetical protein